MYLPIAAHGARCVIFTDATMSPIASHTKAEDHRRGHRHVRSHRLHLHPRAAWRRITTRPIRVPVSRAFLMSWALSLDARPFARTLKPSWVELLTYQIED